MADPAVHPTDAGICRLLVGGPLPTGTIAARLALPARTARYRLARLRQAGVVITGADGLHRVAGILPHEWPASEMDNPGGGAVAAGQLPTLGTASTQDGSATDGSRSVWELVSGYRAASMVVVAVGIGVVAVMLLRRPPNPPPPIMIRGGWPSPWQ